MNRELAQKLITMAEEDQRVLHQLFETGELPSEDYHPKMQAVHDKNVTALKEIIKEQGWPGISLVGKDGAQSAWLIAQHAVSHYKFMTDSVKLLKDAVTRNDIESWQFAFLQDRILTMSGKEQIYGTQFDVDEKGWPVPFPIKEAETVNQRRKNLGLNSLEERQEEMFEREKKFRKQKKSNNDS